MTQIEKYIERLKTLQNLYEEEQPQHNAFGIAIVEANEMLVKNCFIPAVVGQSEQFTCSCGIPPAIRLCEGVETCLKCGERLSK